MPFVVRSGFLALVTVIVFVLVACGSESGEHERLEWCLDHSHEVIAARDSLGLLGDWEAWLQDRGLDMNSTAPLTDQDTAIIEELSELVDHPDPATAEANRVAIRTDWLSATPDGIRSCESAFDAR